MLTGFFSSRRRARAWLLPSAALAVALAALAADSPTISAPAAGPAVREEASQALLIRTAGGVHANRIIRADEAASRTVDSATAQGPLSEPGGSADRRGTSRAAATQAERKPIESVDVTATGYTAGAESTGKRPGERGYGITYSGVKVRRDHVSTIAADPEVFPIGTLLYIPGYGYGVVADTGSAIKGNKIDLYFETTRQVYKQWGKRKVKVDVLIKGDGKLKESWLKELNRAVSAGKQLPVEKLES